ncbi:f box only protein 47 [Echinococcus multilocularis]|uniref:F box only protein 47 n=1 Tax=Echinococcus multilocularis TaxID=6211 RepID=A0A068Y4Z4_ECHMU|nr:f box only protein 47 [Echinococcus multilocularis]
MSVKHYLSSSICTQLCSFRNPHPPNAPDNFVDVNGQLDYFSQVGILFRRIYCFLPPLLRIQFLDSILRAYLCHNGFEPKFALNHKSKQSLKKDHSKELLIKGTCILGSLRCPSTFYFGHFLRSFLSDSSPNEYQRVFHSLVHSCYGQNFWLKLTNLLCKKPDECPDEELAVRLFLRRIFLDPISFPLNIGPTWADLSSTNATASSSKFGSFPPSSTDLLTSSGYISSASVSFRDDSFDLAAFRSQSPGTNLITSTPLIKPMGGAASSNNSLSRGWPTAGILADILHSYPFVHQARLLFILYGPVHKARLMWNIMCENTAADLKQLSACFGELGRVLNSLWLSGHWSASDTIAVLHEITNTPDGWLAENVACLLHSAGPQLASLAVQHKASKGYVTELAVILTSLCLVQVKIKENLSGLLKLVGDAVQATGSAYREEFLDSLSNAFRGVIVDLYETDELDERLEDFSIILKAQSYFFRALLARVYEE